MTVRGLRPALAAIAIALLAPAASAEADTCVGADEPVTAANVAEAERTLLCLVNVYRAANGVGVLTHDPILNRVARAHSEDMRDRGFFDHVNPDGLSPRDRAAAAGYAGGVGENIALSGFPGTTPDRMLTQWKNSPGHNANLLDLHGVTTVTAGMGFATGGGLWGTQMFGTRAGAGTDTAIDLLIPDECPPAEAQRAQAEQRVAKAKKQVKRWKRKLRRADGAKKKRAKKKLKRAKRKLRKARAAVSAADAEVRRACEPSSY